MSHTSYILEKVSPKSLTFLAWITYVWKSEQLKDVSVKLHSALQALTFVVNAVIGHV